ncbi:uncharacterized protein [Euwallacea similis]|uniref:uncharacterized protein n=1 Tax=Euwallacea similis TaxID=1736056 RepID=UPI00344BA2C7
MQGCCLRNVQAKFVARLLRFASVSIDSLPVPAEFLVFPVTKMNMDFESQRKLVQMYGNNRLLWDTNLPDFYNVPKKEKVWREISQELSVAVEELKRKIKSLMASYRRERSRLNLHKQQGQEYTSNWFAFPWFQFYEEHKRKENKTTATSTEIKPPSTNSLEGVQISYNLHITDEDSNSQAAQEEHHITFNPAPPKKIRLESPESEAMSLDKEIVMGALLRRNSDHYEAFGNLVASELRKYDSRTLPYVKRAILDVLFKADIGEFEAGVLKVDAALDDVESSGELKCKSEILDDEEV